jgi:hypothetical protein
VGSFSRAHPRACSYSEPRCAHLGQPRRGALLLGELGDVHLVPLTGLCRHDLGGPVDVDVLTPPGGSRLPHVTDLLGRGTVPPLRAVDHGSLRAFGVVAGLQLARPVLARALPVGEALSDRLGDLLADLAGDHQGAAHRAVDDLVDAVALAHRFSPSVLCC